MDSAKSLGRLAGKSALVTGGGRGIGRAICQVFAKEGASVAVLDVNSKTIEETLKLLDSSHGNKHCAIVSDVTSAEEAKKSFETAKRELGIEATILVNNAGIEKGAFLDDLTEQDYDDVMGVNAKGTFLMSKEFLLSVKDGSDGDGSPRGVIVNMSSMAGKRGFPEKSNYSASKFAIVGLTKTTAMEYGKHKVRCNAVLPSFINTPMILSLDEQTSNILKQQNPMGRFGEPEEVANVCLFLASDESSYVNGACLEICGGFGV